MTKIVLKHSKWLQVRFGSKLWAHLNFHLGGSTSTKFRNPKYLVFHEVFTYLWAQDFFIGMPIYHFHLSELLVQVKAIA